MRLPRGPLGSRNFRLLLACNVVSLGGTAIAVVALPFAVLASGGSVSDVGYVPTAEVVPVVAFLLAGGVVADRLPRQRVLLAANAGQALAQAAAAGLVLTGGARVWELAVLAGARGTGFGFSYPAAAGLLPQTVPAALRARANAMDRIGRNGAQIGGAALGGVLVGVAGPGWGLAVDAASFAVAAVLRGGMRFPALPPVAAVSMLRQLREGWREFSSRRWLWVIVAEFACFNVVFAATTGVLGPVVCDARLGGARAWGIILAVYAAGAVAGGVIMLRFRPQRMLVAGSVSVAAFSLFLFALAVPLMVPLIAAAALLAGVGPEVFLVNWATTLQQEIEPGMLSRVSAYDGVGSFSMAPAGTAAAGPLAGIFGVPAVLAAGGIVIVLLTAAVLLVPDVRHIQRQDAATEQPDG
jgi:Transmembrane secretion effector